MFLLLTWAFKHKHIVGSRLQPYSRFWYRCIMPSVGLSKTIWFFLAWFRAIPCSDFKPFLRSMVTTEPLQRNTYKAGSDEEKVDFSLFSSVVVCLNCCGWNFPKKIHLVLKMTYQKFKLLKTVFINGNSLANAAVAGTTYFYGTWHVFQVLST